MLFFAFPILAALTGQQRGYIRIKQAFTPVLVSSLFFYNGVTNGKK